MQAGPSGPPPNQYPTPAVQMQQMQQMQRMQQMNYQNQMRHSAKKNQSKRKTKPIEMLDWRTTVEIIKTYIGIMIVCALIHYVIELVYDTLRDKSSHEAVLKIADLFEYLDTAFLVSAFIAIIIKAISDTWGVMSYSKIVNVHFATEELNTK